MTLSSTTIKIVKQTAPVLAEHGTTITSTMYKNMFANHPSVKTFFNMEHQRPTKGETVGAQPKSLAQAVHAYAENIDNISVLLPAVERIAEKHVSLFVKPEQYEIVGSELIGAIKQVLGNAATPDIINAWTEAYQFLAQVFIDKENALATEKAENGGWFDMKEFSVRDVVKETSTISSLYLVPKDGSSVPPTWKAGQYVGIRHKVGDEEIQRNYSISCPPGSDHIRLTIKKERYDDQGPMPLSHELHKLKESDTIRISVPCGHFVLKEPVDDKPLVFTALGVGITPLLPMAVEAAKKYKNPIVILQGAHNESSMCLTKELQDLQDEYANVSYTRAFRNPELKGTTATTVSPSWIVDQTTPDSTFYFCGPTSWMQEVFTYLTNKGIPQEKLNYEFFGPTLQL